MNNSKSYLLISLCFYFIYITPVNAIITHEIGVDEKGFTNTTNKIISIGDILRFTNTGTKQHQIQSKSGLFFDSGLLNPGVSSELILKSQAPFRAIREHTLTFIDTEMPEHEASYQLLNEPVIIFPRDAWVLKTYPLNILILFGNETLNFFSPVLPTSRIQDITFLTDGIEFYNGSPNGNYSGFYFEFNNLDYVTVGPELGANGQQGYLSLVLTVDPSTLAFGLHTFTVKVTLIDGSQYEDTVRYTILEPTSQ